MYWDPSPEMLPFNIPFLGRPILWYGFFFALGFFLGYWVFLYLLKHHAKKEVRDQAAFLAEKMTLYVVLGTVIGARLGEFFFYQTYSEWLQDPLWVFKIWKGGLASHGGAVGILVALFLFQRRYKVLSWLGFLDLLVIPTGLVGFCIRIGNFINQEILGKETNVPWAVVFGHPIDRSLPAARHPVQLYEAFFYLLVFFLLFFLRKNKREGFLAGLFLVLVFVFRFGIEFLKEEQSPLMGAHAWIDMGQILSVPFVIFGLFLLFRK